MDTSSSTTACHCIAARACLLLQQRPAACKRQHPANTFPTRNQAASLSSQNKPSRSKGRTHSGNPVCQGRVRRLPSWPQSNPSGEESSSLVCPGMCLALSQGLDESQGKFRFAPDTILLTMFMFYRGLPCDKDKFGQVLTRGGGGL